MRSSSKGGEGVSAFMIQPGRGGERSLDRSHARKDILAVRKGMSLRGKLDAPPSLTVRHVVSCCTC